MHRSGQSASAPRTRLQRNAHKVYVIQVGYCSDLRHPDKRVDKLKQHADLVTALRNAGWDVAQRETTVITFGHTHQLFSNPLDAQRNPHTAPAENSPSTPCTQRPP